MSRALVGARERWKQGDLADFALVSASQRSWAMIQVVLQLSMPTRRPADRDSACWTSLVGNPKRSVGPRRLEIPTMHPTDHVTLFRFQVDNVHLFPNTVLGEDLDGRSLREWADTEALVLAPRTGADV